MSVRVRGDRITTWRDDVKPRGSRVPGKDVFLVLVDHFDESMTLGGPPVEIGQETAIKRPPRARA